MTSAPLVLVVDDESMIYEMLAEGLSEAGFETAQAASGESAIALLESNETGIDALVTDINLVRGGETGWNVAVRAREMYPEMPVVYMTGASVDDWAAHGVPNSVLVSKPFAVVQVITAISQLLNKASP